MISIDDVCVSLGGADVLDAVSLEAAAGQFLALVGPNGAGKTTLLRTCNGLLTPDSGSLRVGGRDVSSLSARETGRLVATVPQETTLAFDFDVESVVAMGRTPHHSRFETRDDADRAAVEAALKRTDTARFADRSVESLSGGQRQRVVLARALAQATPVLLLDEPTANLDINHQIRALELARELATAGKTVVAAIHDLDLAARFCDTVAVLSGGSILSQGTPEDVLTAERLEAAFDVRAAVSTNPVTGTRAVTPLADAPPEGRRVHVLGGGGRTARVIGRLVDAGIEVTAGVLPEGDTALTAVKSVGIEVVTAPRFQPVPADRREAAAALVADAEVVVVAAELGAANRALASEASPLYALEGTDPPSDARVVSGSELPAAVQEAPDAHASRTEL